MEVCEINLEKSSGMNFELKITTFYCFNDEIYIESLKNEAIKTEKWK